MIKHHWWPICLPNVTLKTISKAFASRLKTVLPSIISSEQTAYIEKWFKGKSGRLISDIFSVTNNLKIKSYLVNNGSRKSFRLTGS